MKEQVKHFETIKRPIITEKTIKMFENEQQRANSDKVYTPNYSKVVVEVDVKASRDEVKRAFEVAFPGTKVEKVNIIVSKPRVKKRGRYTQKIGKKKKAIIKLSKDSRVDVYGLQTDE